VQRDLLDSQRLLFGPGLLAELVGGAVGAGAHVDRHSAGEVGQVERLLAVAAIGGADQLEEHLVLGDRKGLAFAEHPAIGREIPGEHADLTDIGLSHRATPVLKI
jgi:hypothetical protein